MSTQFNVSRQHVFLAVKTTNRCVIVNINDCQIISVAVNPEMRQGHVIASKSRDMLKPPQMSDQTQVFLQAVKERSTRQL